jgi:uncharacterized CHY-type Zn-finger protein
MIQFTVVCPKCKTEFDVDFESDSNDEQCPKCQHRFEPEAMIVSGVEGDLQ